jgi:polar amino acid transport system substrate-binding protein
MVFAKGNPLVACVNQALDTMKSNGTLDQLTKKWLKVYTSIPSLEP